MRGFTVAAIVTSLVVLALVLWGSMLIHEHESMVAATKQGTNGPIAGLLVLFVAPIAVAFAHGLVIASLAIAPGVEGRTIARGLAIASLGPALVGAVAGIVVSWFSVYLAAPGELNGQPVWPVAWSILLGEFVGGVLVGVPGLIIRLGAKNGGHALPVEADSTDLDELFR